MFKKHAIQLTMVKTPTPIDQIDMEPRKPFLNEAEQKLALDTIRTLIFTVAGTVAALIVLHTVSEIVINSTNPTH